jgi:alkylhydroperoxidase/carboxymuconolactone decarboxylase family protein YurZ
MVFKMVREQESVFDRCKENSLDPKTTELVRFAAQLAAGNELQAKKAFTAAKKSGLSAAEMSRAACLAACSAGPKVTAAFANLSGIKAQATDEKRVFSACTEKTFDDKTHHLVSLAVCLVSNCACASGHLIRLHELKVDEASIHRAACLAACEGGLRVKYSYIEHLENVKSCSRCVC